MESVKLSFLCHTHFSIGSLNILFTLLIIVIKFNNSQEEYDKNDLLDYQYYLFKPRSPEKLIPQKLLMIFQYKIVKDSL